MINQQIVNIINIICILCIIIVYGYIYIKEIKLFENVSKKIKTVLKENKVLQYTKYTASIIWYILGLVYIQKYLYTFKKSTKLKFMLMMYFVFYTITVFGEMFFNNKIYMLYLIISIISFCLPYIIDFLKNNKCLTNNTTSKKMTINPLLIRRSH
jgi:hypothetical protein